MIEQLVPPWVAPAETYEDLPGATLFPEESAVVRHAAAKRQSEFATVRACARAAMARLGLPPAPILPGSHGAPIWPSGVVGSITHCDGYRAAVVANDRDAASIGIDAEPHDALPMGVLSLVGRPRERARLAELGVQWPEVHWDRVLFSAKESLYKAWYPLNRRWLNFHDVSVTVDPPAGLFTAHLLVRGLAVDGSVLTAVQGRYAVIDDLVLTAITISRGK